MRIIGFPEEPDEDGGILPITIVGLTFHGTPEELRTVGEFLLKAAAEFDLAQASNLPLNLSIDLGNSNPHAEVGILVSAVRDVDEQRP